VPYQELADAVLLLHFAVVLFVVGGLALILIGNARDWHWVNDGWFRITHLAAIAVVVVQSWLGQHCPLTILESWLRVQAGAPAYEQSFIEHWVQRIIYYDVPLWAFAVIYTVFAAFVVLSWWRFPPRRIWRAPGNAGDAEARD
jgi:hypothetical protein